MALDPLSILAFLFLAYGIAIFLMTKDTLEDLRPATLFLASIAIQLARIVIVLEAVQ